MLAWGQAFRDGRTGAESSAQGRAFVDAVRAAWPHPRLDAFDALARQLDRTPTLPVAVGVACAVVGIGEAPARLACLQAFAANLVSAGIRLIPLGQSEGLRVLAGLEETVRTVAEELAVTRSRRSRHRHLDGRLVLRPP